MFTFGTTVEVPKKVIEEIGTQIRKLLQKRLLSDEFVDLYERQIYQIDNVMQNVIDQIASQNKKSYEGWELDRDTIRLISEFLCAERKIDAIKTFRVKTGADLKSAKHLIDNFPLSEEGALSFRKAFQ